MNTLHTIALTLAALWVFWLLYVFTMGLYRAFLMGRLKGLSLLMCAPVVAVAFVLDLLMQFTGSTTGSTAVPRDWLVTHRLRRYMRELPKEHWRRRWADYLCHHLLDPLSIAQAWLDKHLSSTAAAPPIDRLATLRHPKDALP